MPKTHQMRRKTTVITEDQVAIICPTKNQPKKVKRLLLNICNLKTAPGQVIIADGGHNLKPLVDQFKKSLNLICLYCPEPGQVLQRNHARTFLSDDIYIVLHIDDDNTFEPDALVKLLDFWNRESHSKQSKQLAGVSFNVVDLPTIKEPFLHKIAFLGTTPPGSLTLGGYARPFSPTDRNAETSWLLGGSTAWSRDILDSYPHPLDFRTKWAVCEDLMYSYPIGKNYRLMIAKDATAFHNETYEDFTFRKSVFYGLSSSIMRYFFVATYDEFNKLAFFWMTVCIALHHLTCALFGRKKHAGLFLGTILGLIKILWSKILSIPPKRLAQSLPDSIFAKG